MSSFEHDGDEFVVFRRFSEIGMAQSVESTLKQGGVECQVVNNSPTFDASFSGSTLKNEVQIKIRQYDFETAEKLLEREDKQFIDEVGDDHYLYDFNEEELVDILKEYDQWSEFDYLLAQRVLKERGIEYSDDQLIRWRKERVADLGKAERADRTWILFGYVFAVVGGIFGFIIGWVLYTSTKTLPDGQKVKTYVEEDRKHGKNIMIVAGSIIFGVLLLTFLQAQ